MATIIVGNPIVVNVSIVQVGLTAATGMIVLQDNFNTILTQHTTNGTTTFNLTTTTSPTLPSELGLGTHNLVAWYAGDENYAAGESMSLVYDVVV